jgi:hypothetical protein
MKKLVIYHGGECRDGFASAWLFRTAFPDAEMLAAQYGESPPNVTGQVVYMVDFSYPHEVLRRMVAETAGELTILDHHKTAERELAGLEGHYIFDLNKSGARLAWEFLFDNNLLPAEFVRGFARDRAPWLVDYTEDRDLWLWKLPLSREINAALRSYPLDFAVWDKLHTLGKAGRHVANTPLVDEGRAILRAESQIVAAHVRNAAEIELDGHKVLCVNATTLISEIAGELAAGRPFGASYFDRADGLRIWSLRSREGGMDVSEIAKRHGGGGHRNAAGFEEKKAG